MNINARMIMNIPNADKNDNFLIKFYLVVVLKVDESKATFDTHYVTMVIVGYYLIRL